MRVLVIGGAGYIGAHILLALEEAGHTPFAFDNLSTGIRQNVPKTVELIVGSILDDEALDAAFAYTQPDAVIHLAAKKAAGESMRDPALYTKVNIGGSANVLSAMQRAGCSTIIFSSSAAVYGSPQYTPMDEAHPKNPDNFYGYTKLAVEELLRWHATTIGIRSVSLRYFNAAGYDALGRISAPEKKAQNLLPILLETLSGVRQYADIYGTDYSTPDGTCIRDYVHVTDLARAHVAALLWITRQPKTTSIALNLGTGRGTSVKECIAAVESLYGPLPVRYVERRPGDPAIIFTDAHQAQELLQWTPHYTDIKQIIETMGGLYGLKPKK